MTEQPIYRFLNLLNGVKKSSNGWEAKCPTKFHERNDRRPSLSVSIGDSVPVVATCHKGCDIEMVCKAIGLEVSDLFEQHDDSPTVINTYPYTDEAGKTLFVKQRLFPKDFRLTKPDGTYGIKGIRRVLYKLPKLIEAIRLGKPVWLVAGEKDANALEALGEVATTNSEGEATWREEYTAALSGAKVRMLIDRDDAGRKRAEKLGAILGPVTASLELWEPAEGKDITEHLSAGLSLEEVVPYGTSKPILSVVPAPPEAEELVSMVRDGDAVIGECPLPGKGLLCFEATAIYETRTGVHAKTVIKLGTAVLASDVYNVERDETRRRLANSAAETLGDKSEGKAIKLRYDEFCRRIWEEWIRGDEPELLEPTPPTPIRWLIEPFVAEGSGTILYGQPKTCKSWTALLWAASMAGAPGPWNSRGGNVLFVNLERPKATVAGRLWGVTRAIGAHRPFHVWNRRGQRLASLAPSIKRHVGADDLVIVDSLSRAGTGNLNDNDAANEAMDLLNGLGCAWCVIAHAPRHDDSHVFGSQMFDAAADLLVRVQSAVSEDGTTRAVLLDRKAANDAPYARAQLWALDFDDAGLKALRPALPGEFPDIEVSALSTKDRIKGFLLDEGKSDVASIAEGLDLPAGTIRRTLNTTDSFMRLEPGGTGRGKRSLWCVVAGAS